MKLRVLLLAAVVALAAFAVPAMAQQSTFIDPAIKQHLQKAGEVDLLVHMRDSADLSGAFGKDWEERGQYVYDELTRVAKHSQAGLLEKLNQLEGNYDSYQSFWISNVVIVNGANNTLFEAVASRRDFKALTVAPVYSLPDPIRTGDAEEMENRLMAGVATNIEQIRAPEVWADNIKGDGVVVAIIDSGTRYTHEALVNQYRGNLGDGSFDHNYNWFDIAGTTEPQWPNPHGSHVTGTAVGDNGVDEHIGVAPEADWISCLGCTSNGCPGANLLACAEFVAAPTDLGGSNPEPDLRPHVVNNSWGDCGQTYDGWYQDSVDAWIAAGIIPVAANGNASNCGYASPPGLNTVGNPGRYGSILGIGSTGNNNGQYAPHSNWGPTDNPNDGTDPTRPDPRGYFDLKPNVAAPGVNIWSVNSGSDTGYTSSGFSGTSMSAPAATGTIALMLSAAPSLKGDYATIGTLLMETANPVPYDTGSGNEGPGMVPNYATGWGEIDAYNAVQAAIAATGPRGTLQGNVVDDSTNLPIKNAAVNASNAAEDETGSTDSSGSYSLGLAQGSYAVEFTAFGYQPVIETDIEIENGQTTNLDISMVAADTHVVSGTVTDSVTGWPLHASISIDGYPGGTIYTDPADGSYAVDLPEGMEFEFTVTAVAGGYDFAIEDVGPLSGDDVQDFGLNADLDVCDAPGYDNASSALLSESFDDLTTPAGWSVEDLDNSNGLWAFDDPGGRGNKTGGDGGFAIIDSDHNGSGGDQDTAMVTPSIDLSAAASAELQFKHDFYDFSGSSGSVDVSTDGGVTWETVWGIDGDSDRGPKTISASLDDYVGEPDVMVRWHYKGSWDWYWQVDDVEVIAYGTCEPQSGELVYGVVSDANDSQPLNGVTVEVDGTSFSATTTSNPDLGGGAYYLFVPEGSQDVIASLDGYGDAQVSDTFVDGETRRLDLELTSGLLSVLPEELSSTVTFGESKEEALILINDGSADISVDLSIVVGFEEDFEGDFPPAGWTVENFGGDCVWMTNEDYGAPNYAGGDGLSATADANVCGLFA
ncbi:MAG TPA: S8 family serine peptidase, partial [Wenzhouxiangella sp.]|nr:S8 family serine peptidase [Wenzhouxiangella sp.]